MEVHQHVPTELLVENESTELDELGTNDRMLTCPLSFTVDAAGARADSMYDGLITRHKPNVNTVPLRSLSFYGTSRTEWAGNGEVDNHRTTSGHRKQSLHVLSFP